MAAASLVLGFLSFVCMVVGFFTTAVPFVGALFSFSGPVLGIAGIVTGGIAMSRSRQETGEADGIAIGGLIVSVIGFLLSLIVALTCGLCNACTSTSSLANANNNTGSAGSDPFGLGGLANQFGDRVELTLLLSQVRSSCSADPSGASATAFMLPAAAPTMQGSICAEIGPNTDEPFSNVCAGSARSCTTHVSADAGPDAAVVRALGVEPATCTTYAVPDGSTRITVCPDASGAKKLAVATNLGAVR